MAYSELIKNFDGIRDYMREFYVYGFKSREEFTNKSARSYDDERRRVESWLGDYMGFRRTTEGKNVFLSIDSRVLHHNPLYKAWKAKSFTDGDITLHFLLFDVLYSSEISLTLNEITEAIDNRLECFELPKTFDISTVRKKLKEYCEEGLIISEKNGKTAKYRRFRQCEAVSADVLDFFSEVSPCGVIGSFLLDKIDIHDEHFAFKHHYITSAFDSDVLCSLFIYMHEKRFVVLKSENRTAENTSVFEVVPLRVFISVQNGRQYIMAYMKELRSIRSFRLDNILSVTPGDICENYEEYRNTLDNMQAHIWGVSTANRSENMGHVEFTVRYSSDEEHIHRRLEREKRSGTVERIDKNTSRFSADVYDAGELVPWIRTFICRIIDIHFSDKILEAQFKKDLQDMYSLYGISGGDKP